VNPAAPDRRLAAQPPPGDRATYRLLHLNLRYNNPSPEKVLSLIGRTQPDIVSLTEVSDMWRERLEVIAHAYPHRIVCPPPSRIGGVAMLSRRPFAEGSEPACHERGALAVARIDLSGEAINVAALHIGWPWPFDQPAALPRVTRHLARLRGPGIVAGDFNAAPWSWTVRSIAQETGFRTVEGAGPTWLFLSAPDWLRRPYRPADRPSDGETRRHPARHREARRCRFGSPADPDGILGCAQRAAARGAARRSRLVRVATGGLTYSGRPAPRRPAAGPS
jgi:endonuclease/exonuclease/phosphatase (EEP) superfamily protein YafD